MPNPRLAARYAKSLIDLAIERGQLEEVYRDMQYLQQVIRSSREFLALLRSPVVKADKKTKIVGAVTGGNIGQLTTAFNNLLISKAREEHLPEIITAFIQQYKDYKGIQVVKLTTAAPVSESVKNAIVERVRQTSDMKNIELQEVVNPNLIGGFVLQVGDRQIDASISSDLREVARQFENNDFIYKVK